MARKTTRLIRSGPRGGGVSYRTLQLTFQNTDESAATIEHSSGDFTGTHGSGDAQCAVTAVKFADGRQWTAPVGTAAAPGARDPRADRAFHPDYSKALTPIK